MSKLTLWSGLRCDWEVPGRLWRSHRRLTGEVGGCQLCSPAEAVGSAWWHWLGWHHWGRHPSAEAEGKTASSGSGHLSGSGEVQVAHAAGFFGKIVYLRLWRLKVHWIDPLGKSTFHFLNVVLCYNRLFGFEVGVPVAPFALKSMWIFAEQIFLKRHCSTTKVLNFAKIDPSFTEVLNLLCCEITSAGIVIISFSSNMLYSWLDSGFLGRHLS